MKIRSSFRWLLTSIMTMVFLPFVQAPATKLAEHLHFDSILSNRWEPIILRLATMAQNPWYIFIAGIAAGMACVLWIDFAIRKINFNKPNANSENHNVDEEITSVSGITPKNVQTLIRLQFRGGQQAPIEIRAENILNWYTVWGGKAEIDFSDDKNNTLKSMELPTTWVLFVSFDKPISYRQIIVEPASIDFPRYEVKSATPFHVIITTFGKDPPRGLLDIYTKF